MAYAAPSYPFPGESSLQKVVPGHEGAPLLHSALVQVRACKVKPSVQGLSTIFSGIPLDRMGGLGPSMLPPIPPLWALTKRPLQGYRTAVPDGEVGAEASDRRLCCLDAFYLDCSTPTALPPGVTPIPWASAC